MRNEDKKWCEAARIPKLLQTTVSNSVSFFLIYEQRTMKKKQVVLQKLQFSGESATYINTEIEWASSMVGRGKGEWARETMA